MNPEVKAKWMAALLSGKYRQGRTRLRTEVLVEPLLVEPEPEAEYCCLGVLCDLEGVEWFRDGAIYQRVEGAGYREEADGIENGNFYATTELPKALRSALGITDNQERYLIALNDRHRFDFKQIAEYIAFNL